MPETIAAVVVTFNRKQLLTQCLNALLSQTRVPDKIFVIDNASSDGTEELLKEKGYLDKTIVEYVQLSENTGGAGGFYEGMKRAYEANYDWLWLMDDDGYSAPDCLEELLAAKDNLDVVGSVALLPENPTQLTWTFLVFNQNGYFSHNRRIRSYDELQKISSQNIYKDYTLFFNAVLVNRTVIQKIGYVNKELFIRGDEFEYFLRCRDSNLQLGTNVNALYYHPYQAPNLNLIKYFYAFRNDFYNYVKYRNITYHPAIRLIYLIYAFIKYLSMIPSLSPTYIIKVINAVWFATQGRLIPYS